MSTLQPSAVTALALSYRALRKCIGALGLVLPLVLVVGAVVLDHKGVRPSISDYYYTSMRNYFVGTMCAIGVFLASYRYRDTDNVWSNVGSAFAIGVALFPTPPSGVSLTGAQRAIGIVHGLCAGGLFTVFAIFSLFLFTRTDPQHTPTARKGQRNAVYRTCGILIAASIVSIPLSGSVVSDALHPVFWLETVAVLAFAVSWLVKGEIVLADQG